MPKPGGGSSRRSNISASSAAQRQKEDIAAAANKAFHDEKAQAASLRKNKAYLQLKRDMEQRMRQRAKQAAETGERRVEVAYVDRDRAAAVGSGGKDIKNELRGKKARDRTSAEPNEEDTADRDTFLAQGQHELKNGEAKRALFYLNKASTASSQYEESLYILRSQANCLMGHYDLADMDADTVLADNPFSVKGLVAKAESQYHQGAFEHALKFYQRALLERPDYHEIKAGLNKAKIAIENSLSKANGFDFLQMKEIINEIDEAKAFPFEDKGKEEPKPREILESFAVEASESKIEPIEFEDIDSFKQEVFENGEDEGNGETKKTSKQEDALFAVDMSKIMGTAEVKPKLSSENVLLSKLRGRIATAKKNVAITKHRQKIRENRAELKLADKQLLGKLHYDHVYLESLVKNPLLTKKYKSHGEGSNHMNVVQKRILQCANEGLQYLDSRKDFWQKQKPVYARKNELNAHKRPGGGFLLESNRLIFE